MARSPKTSQGGAFTVKQKCDRSTPDLHHVIERTKGKLLNQSRGGAHMGFP